MSRIKEVMKEKGVTQQMLADSEKNSKWEIVLVYALDRFGRNSTEVAVNKQRLRKNGKTLISATQRTSVNIDGSRNLDGILLENVYIGIAEYYSAELSEKILRGQKENRKKLFTKNIKCFLKKKQIKKCTKQKKRESKRYDKENDFSNKKCNFTI